MTFSFRCPHCGHETLVDDRYAGQSGSCSACGQPIQLPGSPFGAAPVGPPKSSGTGWVVALLAVLLVAPCCVIAILVALLLPAIDAAREAARRMQTANNMKMIAIALHNYHDANRTFPPAYIADENGQPMHSWRVLILPYLEESWLYEQYDFDQPWNSPHNLTVADRMPEVFECTSAPGELAFFVVNAPGGVFDGDRPTRIQDITDGTSNTILFVQSHGARVRWTEPVDLDARALAQPINAARDGTAMSSPFAGGALIGLADGSVRFVQVNDAPPTTLQAMATKAGGEVVPLP